MSSRRVPSFPRLWPALMLLALLVPPSAHAQLIRRPGATLLPLQSTSAPIPSTTLDEAKLQLVNGAQGCTMNCANWELIMPAGLFSGYATVTVSDMKNTVPQVNLDLSNQTLDRFATPVTLIYHCPSNVDVASRAFYWWDPANKTWAPVPGLVTDVDHGTISVPLWHFSTYAVGGKAGW